MSLAKIHKVAKSQKDQGKCGKCGVELPKGTPYIWYKVGFRTRYAHKRCTKTECFPRESERESSSRSEVYSAQESFTDATSGDELTIDDLNSALQDFKSAVEEYASEREYGLEAWENGNSQLQEIADAARQAADEAEYIDEAEEFDEEEPDEESYDPEDNDDLSFAEALEAYNERLMEHIAAERDRLVDAVTSLEF